MAEESMFWNGLISEGAPGDAGGYTDVQFSEWVKAVFEGRTGVLEGLAVTESSPAGAHVTVSAGKAIIRGRFYHLDAPVQLVVTANVSGNPRKDRVVLRCDWSAQTIRLAVKEGTPAGSPTLPTLTQSDGTTWELSLSAVNVANGFSSIVNPDITRDRKWARVEKPGDTKFSFSPNQETDGEWVLCDGRAISRTTYIDLFDAIGVDHGVGDGSTTFNIPDLRGRVPAGMDNLGTAQGSANVVTNAAADTVGGGMGEETHALTANENGPHTHYYSQGLTSGIGNNGGVYGQVDGGSNDDLTASSGLGTPHNTMQPTRFGYWYVRL